MLKDFLKLAMPASWRRKVQEFRVSASFTHVHGPKRLGLSSHEAVVTCVVRNGAFYIEEFIKHYSEMGFRHVFFLDNGSSDQTIEIAKRHSNVTVYKSDLPVGAYQDLMKKCLARKATEGGWCLDADIDEFFDYPFSSTVTLSEFLDYLNQRRYTAVLTQMLDMFPEKPLSVVAQEAQGSLKTTYNYYDISDVTKTMYGNCEFAARYGSSNILPNIPVLIMSGGIRRTICGNECMLTKHSLFVQGEGLELFPHVHFVNHARLADVSCLMLHYKLTSEALATALQNRQNFSYFARGYDDFINFILNKPDYPIRQSTAVRFCEAEDLVESGFLFMSATFRKYAAGIMRNTMLVH
jgi:hypothetical protein